MATVPDDTRAPAGKQSTTFIGLTMPPVGIGYYRLNRVTAVPETPEETDQPSREDGRQSVQGLSTSHLGLTLGQSLGDYLVVAGTVKYVQGEVHAGTFVGSPEDALEASDTFGSRSTSRFDVDAGVMLAVEQWRAGLLARNLTAPSFDGPDPDSGAVELDREFRVGVAWGQGWPGITRLVVSADADLTRKPGRDRRSARCGGRHRDVVAAAAPRGAGRRAGQHGR